MKRKFLPNKMRLVSKFHAVATLRGLTPAKTSCLITIFFSSARKLNFQPRTMITHWPVAWTDLRAGKGKYELPLTRITAHNSARLDRPGNFDSVGKVRRLFLKSNSLVILALVCWTSKNRGKNLEAQIEIRANCRLILTTTYFALLNFEFWSKLPFMHHGTWIVC